LLAIRGNSGNNLVEESAVTLLTRAFAQPWMLWLLCALPAITMLLAWARWRRRRALLQLGTPYLVERLTGLDSRRRRGQTSFLLLGLLALAVGDAGPRWGGGSPPERLGGKDIVIVLDLSRSMLAEQPSRLERARRALRDLAETLETRGGHRVALVTFAAHAKLQFPLTCDYDHFRFVLEQLDADDVPPALRPQAREKIASGTRLGEALRLAAASHDSEHAGRQDIVLLSDGDDPAHDEEWLEGVQAARKQALPVHVVALGDPHEPHPIPKGNDVLRHEGAIVQSKLNEALLQEIAHRTQGTYFPARTNDLALGRLMHGYLERGSDSESASAQADDALGAAAEAHPAWFLCPALIFLGMSMLVGDGRRRRAPRNNWQALRLAMAGLAAFFVSAEPLESVEDLVRRGNSAFATQQFEEALQWYGKAEATTTDPGLVAFNKGATLYRLGRFDEAAVHYQRCLEDQLIPRDRLARASYDLGTAILHARPEQRQRLEQAIEALRHCLDSSPPKELRDDALHNLELARWLWLRAKAASSSENANTSENGSDRPPTQNAASQEQPGQIAKNGTNATNDGGAEEKATLEPGMQAKQKKLGHGALEVLPDDGKLAPLSPEETAAHLDETVARLRRDRRSAWELVPSPPNVKDW
jgi:Ca-activated chloride channel homolog